MKSYESAAEHEPNGQKRTFADGRVAIGYGEEKTIVWVFDEKNWTMYQLNAYLSLDDLMQIAESLNSANEIHEVSYKTFDRNLPEIK
ncbi:MAG TPA: hypothetical protein VJL54_06855 [Nitrososphaera sp.]|nr:hypothetical protein [Nitrososphaera sp.]